MALAESPFDLVTDPEPAEHGGLGLVQLDPESPRLLSHLRQLHRALREEVGGRLERGDLSLVMLDRLELSLAQQSRAARLLEERLIRLGARRAVLAEVRQLRIFLARALNDAGLQLGRAQLYGRPRVAVAPPEARADARLGARRWWGPRGPLLLALPVALLFAGLASPAL